MAVVSKVEVTDGVSTVTLSGHARVIHEHRIAMQPRPGIVGDAQQPLGRESRRVELPKGANYNGLAAQDVAAVQQLRTWADANTVLFVKTRTEENLLARITDLEVIEPDASTWLIAVVGFREVGAQGDFVATGGIGFDAVSEKEVALEA